MTVYTDNNSTAVAICCHDDWYFLAATIRSFSHAGRVTVFVSTCAWDGSVGDWERCVQAAEEAGAEVVVGTWETESAQRKHALAVMKSRNVRWLFIPDSDEVIERKLLDALLALCIAGVFDHFRVRMETFWKSTRYRIYPPEQIAPVILIDCQKCEHLDIREYSSTHSTTLGFEHGALLHLSYVGSDARILRKISTWSHRFQVIDRWFDLVWLAWDKDRTLRNLHPTNAECYGFAERIPVPEVLRGIDDGRPALSEPEIPENWEKISVVIAAYGGPEYLHACLESIRICGIAGYRPKGAKKAGRKGLAVQEDTRRPLLHEVIVVDDCSPEDIAQVVKMFPFVRYFRNETNEGFGASTNRGIKESTGEQVLMLNSDTRLTRAGLISLGATLLSSGTIGAVGPLTNSCGYEQQIDPTYTDIRNLERFACDFSHKEAKDFEAGMVVGFALLVPKRVLNEVGLFDPIYGKCLYEDTDLIQRMKRVGYKTMVSAKSFIFHEGSKSLGRTGIHPSLMLAANRQVFENKHRLDVESGFMSCLAGQGAKIKFDWDRKPEDLIARLREIACREGISVCIIARDEQRVIGDCIRSLLGIFPQVVVLDTGSKDRTMDIARELGAEVHQMNWMDSFSIARNASIRYATGRWIFWVDADDTVPLLTLEAVVMAALNAPAKVNGFVVPCQFVEAIPGTGTRVDHIRLFRADPRHFFEGRIHENVLPSLRATGGELGWIPHPVLHSGYDRSAAGQQKKRIRDRLLLALDLKDRPGHTFCQFNCGMTAYFMGRHKAAIGWLRRSLRTSEGGTHERKAYALLGLALKALGRTEEAAATFQAGLDAVGEDPELRYNLGMSLAELGRFAEARKQYLPMTRDTAGHFASIDIALLTFRPLISLANVCFAMGLEGEAKQHLRSAIAANPRFSGSAQLLFDAAVRTGDIVAARDAAQATLAAEGTGESWALMRAAVADMAGIGADQELIRLTSEMPQAIGPGLILTRRMIVAGQIQSALPLLSRLEYLGSAEAAHYLGQFEANHGNLDVARHHTGLALQLNPGSIDSLNQLEAIELRLDDLIPLPPYSGGYGSDALIGPHAGSLGPASLERSVVVVTFNSAGTISECIERVQRTLGDNDELIVVDNASTDATLEIVEALAAADPRVRVLPQADNIGYSAGCNAGILASRGAAIVALNPDAYVNGGWLEAMEDHLVENVAAVGPVSSMVAGDQFVGRYLGGRKPQLEELPGIMEAEQGGVSKKTKLLMGVCLMMRRDLLDKHGLLCEETALGADDLEFSWRFRTLGYELKVAPGVFVHHVGGASFATVPSIETRKKVRRSDRALMQRLRAYYGDSPIPSSQELWGCDIFAEAMALHLTGHGTGG